MNAEQKKQISAMQRMFAKIALDKYNELRGVDDGTTTDHVIDLMVDLLLLAKNSDSTYYEKILKQVADDYCQEEQS